MSFSGSVRQWTESVEADLESAFDIVVNECFRSVVEGSEITTAPGQPVKTGNLKSSWTVTHENPRHAHISTSVVYAPAIEDGVGPHGPLTLRSKVGGFHSVKITVAGFPLIVEHAAKSVASA